MKKATTNCHNLSCLCGKMGDFCKENVILGEKGATFCSRGGGFWKKGGGFWEISGGF
jgi:hypothetical protein